MEESRKRRRVIVLKRSGKNKGRLKKLGRDRDGIKVRTSSGWNKVPAETNGSSAGRDTPQEGKGEAGGVETSGSGERGGREKGQG